MVIALGIAVIFVSFVWLVFFKLKLLKFTITWGVVSGYVGLHVVLVFVIGLHFMTPYTTEVTVIQHTIQLVPRLPEPTLVTAVMVEPNVPVKKGQPLFQFDRRPYEDKVKEKEADLAAARQNVIILKTNLAAAQQVAAKAISGREALKVQKDILKTNLADTEQGLVKATSARDFAKIQYERYKTLGKDDAGAMEEFQKFEYDLRAREAAVVEGQTNVERVRLQLKQWQYDLLGADATVKEAGDNVEKARLAYTSQIDGVNPRVAEIEASLAQARYYLDNTTMVAPEDGFITNLQVRPGMVAGTFRLGAIAAFIVDSDRYVLGTYYQEHLKYVKPGQPVEVAIDLYPGQIFKGKVDSIWWATGQGQLLPSGELPTFQPPPEVPQGRFAVKIYLDDKNQKRFPIGAQGAAAIYTTGGLWAVLRRISIRTYTWSNWLYPLSL